MVALLLSFIRMHFAHAAYSLRAEHRCVLYIGIGVYVCNTCNVKTTEAGFDNSYSATFVAAAAVDVFYVLKVVHTRDECYFLNFSV